jgi:hypothetical protein
MNPKAPEILNDIVAALKTALTNAGLMDKDGNFTPAAEKYAGLTGLAKSELEKQVGQVDSFNTNSFLDGTRTPCTKFRTDEAHTCVLLMFV